MCVFVEVFSGHVFSVLLGSQRDREDAFRREGDTSVYININ